MPLHVEITRSDAHSYTVKLTGMLDGETADALDLKMVEVWADTKAQSIRMDLSELTYISSVGLGLIAKFRKAITSRGGAMVVVGAQPQIARVFEIAKMLPKQTMFASRKEADEYLAAIQKQVLEEQQGT